MFDIGRLIENSFEFTIGFCAGFVAFIIVPLMGFHLLGVLLQSLLGIAR